MQFGTSIFVFHVRSATSESAVISRPASSVYRFSTHILYQSSSLNNMRMSLCSTPLTHPVIKSNIILVYTPYEGLNLASQKCWKSGVLDRMVKGSHF